MTTPRKRLMSYIPAGINYLSLIEQILELQQFLSLQYIRKKRKFVSYMKSPTALATLSHLVEINGQTHFSCRQVVHERGGCAWRRDMAREKLQQTRKESQCDNEQKDNVSN